MPLEASLILIVPPVELCPGGWTSEILLHGRATISYNPIVWDGFRLFYYFFRRTFTSDKRKVLKAKPSHLCQKSIDQADCKSKDVHEWQGPGGESQQANPQDRPPQYFSENLPHTRIEPALPEDFSPRHLRPLPSY
ncbi:Uncharacterized protein Fot_54622 [Forsythia ovata]|uniref:Uncharacterized protein n=1 Tax=Forsythia ovata TaxID=205694 RepID=A0ABD1P940_9LAMI